MQNQEKQKGSRKRKLPPRKLAFEENDIATITETNKTQGQDDELKRLQEENKELQELVEKFKQEHYYQVEQA